MLRLVTQESRPDAHTIERLESLLAQAQKGELIGFVYAAMLKHRGYIVESTGDADRNRTFARGMLRALDDHLAGQASHG